MEISRVCGLKKKCIVNGKKYILDGHDEMKTDVEARNKDWRDEMPRKEIQTTELLFNQCHVVVMNFFAYL